MTNKKTPTKLIAEVLFIVMIMVIYLFATIKKFKY